MTAENYRITLASGMRELSLSPYSVCRVLTEGLSGFDFPQIDVEYSSTSGEGGALLRRRIDARILRIAFEVADAAQNVSIGDTVRAIMNPHADITVRTYLNGRHRSIRAVPYRAAEFSESSFGDPLKITLTLICPEPYFTDGVSRRISFPVTTPILSFPLNLMSGAGTVCSFAASAVMGNVRNIGDAECGVHISVTAARGSIREPSMSCGGRYVKYTGTLAAGDRLSICTLPGSCALQLNGITTYSFDRASRFFTLSPGDNFLRLIAADGGGNADISVEYTPLYLGA